MRTLKKKHQLAIRWFHWINVPVLFLMIWSGLLIYWSNAVYRVGLGSYTLLSFFPEQVFQALGLFYRLAAGMSLHFSFTWFFAINGVSTRRSREHRIRDRHDLIVIAVHHEHWDRDLLEVSVSYTNPRSRPTANG